MNINRKKCLDDLINRMGCNSDRFLFSEKIEENNKKQKPVLDKCYRGVGEFPVKEQKDSMKIWEKAIRIFLTVVLVMGFSVSLIYFLNGSLEMYPTDEQQEKARIVSSFFMIIFASMSVACIFPFFKKKK